VFGQPGQPVPQQAAPRGGPLTHRAVFTFVLDPGAKPKTLRVTAVPRLKELEIGFDYHNVPLPYPFATPNMVLTPPADSTPRPPAAEG
jgi:hypothetical protein